MLPTAAGLLFLKQLSAERWGSAGGRVGRGCLCWLCWLGTPAQPVIPLGPNLKTSTQSCAVAVLPPYSLQDWMVPEIRALVISGCVFPAPIIGEVLSS